MVRDNGGHFSIWEEQEEDLRGSINHIDVETEMEQTQSTIDEEELVRTHPEVQP